MSCTPAGSPARQDAPVATQAAAVDFVLLAEFSFCVSSSGEI